MFFNKNSLKPMLAPFILSNSTGLPDGLSTVYGIVKQSDGYIRVESEPGQGTTFYVDLPRTAESQTVKQEQKAEITRTEHSKVLLVEDEDATREAITDYLEQNGFQVTTAANAAEALHICETKTGNSIDVLLTDVVMPGMSGVELARIFRSQAPNASIIVMSGYTDDDLTRTGMVNGAHTFLLYKPFSLADLLGQLRHMLSGAAQG
jgi:two-component system, cell cycle sensor histidine kinase and response regulator CckA